VQARLRDSRDESLLLNASKRARRDDLSEHGALAQQSTNIHREQRLAVP
jgi:hypothetical protein